MELLKGIKYNILNSRSYFLFFHMYRRAVGRDTNVYQKSRGLPYVFVSYTRLKLQREAFS